MPKKLHTGREWRVEATVPAVAYVWAATREEAIANAVADRDLWQVDVDAEIAAEHIVDAEEF